MIITFIDFNLHNTISGNMATSKRVDHFEKGNLLPVFLTQNLKNNSFDLHPRRRLPFPPH